MSYDIYIYNPKTKKIISSDYAGYVDSNDYDKLLYLNLTYNYSSILQKIFDNKDGIYILNNKKVSRTIDKIQNAINKLNNQMNKNYWDVSEGNVKFALLKLYQIALLGQDGVWKII